MFPSTVLEASIFNRYKVPPSSIDNMIKYIKLFTVYLKFLYEKQIITIKNPRKSFKIKKEKEDIENRIIKPEIPPKKEPKNNLSLLTLLFNTIDIPSNNMKSNKKLIKKT